MPLDPRRNWTREELQAETREDLIALKDAIDAIRLKIESQLTGAKTQRKATGKRADPDWFQRATTALKHLNQKRQFLQEVIADKKREETGEQKRREKETFARCFMKCAREDLRPGDYKRIIDLATERAEQRPESE